MMYIILILIMVAIVVTTILIRKGEAKYNAACTMRTNTRTLAEKRGTAVHYRTLMHGAWEEHASACTMYMQARMRAWYWAHVYTRAHALHMEYTTKHYAYRGMVDQQRREASAPTVPMVQGAFPYTCYEYSEHGVLAYESTRSTHATLELQLMRAAGRNAARMEAIAQYAQRRARMVPTLSCLMGEVQHHERRALRYKEVLMGLIREQEALLKEGASWEASYQEAVRTTR